MIDEKMEEEIYKLGQISMLNEMKRYIKQIKVNYGKSKILDNQLRFIEKKLREMI